MMANIMVSWFSLLRSSKVCCCSEVFFTSLFDTLVGRGCVSSVAVRLQMRTQLNGLVFGIQQLSQAIQTKIP